MRVENQAIRQFPGTLFVDSRSSVFQIDRSYIIGGEDQIGGAENQSMIIMIGIRFADEF